MDAHIPTAEEVSAALAPLSYAQMQELARLSKQALTTLWKIKTGETKDPGLSKVRAIWPHIEAARRYKLLAGAALALTHDAPKKTCAKASYDDEDTHNERLLCGTDRRMRPDADPHWHGPQRRAVDKPSNKKER